MWGEITYPFPNFNGCTIEVREWISKFIPHFPGHVITYQVAGGPDDKIWDFVALVWLIRSQIITASSAGAAISSVALISRDRYLSHK